MVWTNMIIKKVSCLLLVLLSPILFSSCFLWCNNDQIIIQAEA